MNAFFARPGLAALCGLWLLSAPALHAAGQPVTIKELCLMLRGGYTGDEVLRETAGRPLLEPLDANAETALRAAGADARLLTALHTSHPALSGDEAAAARARQAQIDERNTESRDADRARLLAFHKQSAENHLAALRQTSFDQLATQLRGQLVECKEGGMQPYADSTLAGKKLFAFYCAALTNPQCSKFTPELIKFYRDFAPKHPEFEIVFLSQDMSGFNMENYMRQSGMPWPALAFDHRAAQPGLANLGKNGIPRLVLVAGSGQMVADSFVGDKYVGPQHVLDELTRLAAAGDAPAGQ